MTLPLANDLLYMFNTDEFATSVTYRRALALGQSTIKGIFDNETVPIDAGGYAPVHQEQPRFLCRTVDVPHIAYDDVLVINSTTYYVRAWVDNGQGMVEIQLEKI